MKIKSLIVISLVLFSGLFLSACGKKKTTNNAAPTPPPRAMEMKDEDKPYISLTPREDGHLLKLKISKIPSSIKQVEYELIYKAEDEGMEIEKGVGDTIKEIKGGVIEKDLLLGTESCTNGCKYKYDNGVTGGTVILTMITGDGQVATTEQPFLLRSTAEIKKAGGFSMEDGFEVKAVPAANEYFVVLKNYGFNGTLAKEIYSVFSSGSGKGKINSMSPDTTEKQDKTSLVGDYRVN